MFGPLPFALFSFSALFVIVDPVAVAPIFIALTPDDTPAHRREMVQRACLVAWGLLALFAVGGTWLFRILGVKLYAFKVAGGLLLLLTAIDQLRAQPSPTRTTVEEQHAGSEKEDISITPLAIPLLAGPGSIATTVMLMSRAVTMTDRMIVFAAITFAMGSAYAALMMSERIAKLLGPVGALVTERLSGLVMAAIAAQFVLDGVAEALRR